jgi:serine/threonine-protein kinase SRPK3
MAATLDIHHPHRLRHLARHSSSSSHSELHTMTDSPRPGILHRSRSHLHEYRTGLAQLFQTRSNSPGQPDILSSAKAIEEETQPKYDANKFYPAKLGEILNDRYKIVAKLGYGMTATVWLAKDLHATPSTGSGYKYVTIKININSLSEDFRAGRRKIAEKLASANPNHPGYKHVRFMLSTFKLRTRAGEHLCIVYDVLREPINICMEKWPSRLFSPEKLRKILPPLLQGLDYMHSECRVVHTDLKADNIMMGLGDTSILDAFVQHELDHPSPRKMPDHHGRIIYQSMSDFGAAPTDAIIQTAKITDIGLAEWGDQRNNKPIQSNAFTCPEVILQAGWSYPADIWNLGVVMWDLVESYGLFDAIDTRPGRYNSGQHLGLMIALLGPPPKELLERGNATATYFDENGNFRKPEYINEDVTWESSISRMRGEEKDCFIDFAKKMISWLPEERWTAKQLLDHPFLNKSESEFAMSRVESQQDVTASINLVEQFATTKARSKTVSPAGSYLGTPARTPNRTPEPTGLAAKGRTGTDLSEISNMSIGSGSVSLGGNLGKGPTSAPNSSAGPGGRPRLSNASATSEPGSVHINRNQTSQDLIDTILGHKKKSPSKHEPQVQEQDEEDEPKGQVKESLSDRHLHVPSEVIGSKVSDADVSPAK